MKKRSPHKGNGKLAEKVSELSIKLSGSSHPFNYSILATEVERLMKTFDGDCDFGDFYQIDVHGHWDVWVNTQHLVYFRILKPWPAREGHSSDFPKCEVNEDLMKNSEDSWVVRLWLKGEKKPLVFDGLIKHDWVDIYLAFANEAKCLSFEDEEGELVCVRTDQILAAESLNKEDLTEEELNHLYEEIR